MKRMNGSRGRQLGQVLPAILAGFSAMLPFGSAALAQAQGKLVRIDGSSTVYPATEAVAEEFQIANRGEIHVTVGISGTGGGFKKFCRGETDVSNASRPILKPEMDACRENGVEYIELPVCFDALTVVVNPDNDWVDYLTVNELKKMWEPGAQGKILYWNQIRPEWPAEQLRLFGPGPDSGTFDYFTEATVGKAKSSRGDFTGSEDDNVLVRGVAGDKFALGYFGYAYFDAHRNKLKAVPILWEGHTPEPVAPSLENVLEGKYNPLSRPLFIYASKQSVQNKPWVKKFVEFYLDNAKDLVAEVKYVPIPDGAYAMARQRFSKLQSGTGFGGEPEVGLPVEDILSRIPRQ